MSQPSRSKNQLRALLDAATPRPWTVRRYANGGGRISDEATDRVLVADAYHEGDRELILAAVEALPELLEIAEAGSEFAFCADRDLVGWEGSMDVIKAHERLKAALEKVGLVADLKGK